ncbi:E3 ubiquitin-protein ligase rnf146-like isoform X2 [Periplaneta americana]|uniref:E3 ubiquitin-protein ligase rnf146-like isoform X2 n=1 Tax=Periplaneta americana TaxID=6978 RepID=UPI0037E93FBD
MAESRPIEGVEGDKRTQGIENTGTSIPECAVCLQSCVHPAQLPCGHIFCFLCVKGVANQSKKCAMCRQEIPTDYFEKPVLVAQNNSDKDNTGFDDGYQWFYEGRNGWWQYDERTSMDLEEMLFAGWWQYDERTSRELETAYKKGERICELLVAGLLYVADFDAMLQVRRNDPSRRRRIKRDLATIPKKGVAGLRLEGSQSVTEAEEDGRPKSPSSQGTSDGALTPTPIPPTNTPQTPAGTASGDTTPDRRESLHRAVEQIRSLCLRDDVTASDDSDEDEGGSGDEHQELPDFSGAVTSPWVLTFSSDEDQL